MNWGDIYGDLRLLSPYVLTLVGIVILHHLFFDSFMEFIRFLVSEVRDFAKLKPSLGALNFLGVVAVTIVVALFNLKDLVHGFDARPMLSENAPAAHYDNGMSAAIILFYFVFVLLSIVLCRHSKRR
jgi:hypothetical protein